MERRGSLGNSAYSFQRMIGDKKRYEIFEWQSKSERKREMERWMERKIEKERKKDRFP